MSRRLEYHTRTGLSLSHSHPIISDAGWIPNTDIFESEDRGAYFVIMAVAGVPADKIKVTLKGRLLTVAGERSDLTRGKQRCEFHQMEIEYGPFERRFLIASVLAPDRAKASLNNGMLTIELPKAAGREPKSTVAEDAVPIVVTGG